jgi:hypothetical protein
MTIIKIRPVFKLLCALAMVVAASGHAAAAGPPAPTSLAPADGASVTVPFTISWAAVSDPSGVLGYNWQVSSSSTFTTVALQNSTNAGITQDTVSGLPDGTYFWRVDAVNNAFVTGAWSAAQSFTVTAAGPGEPGSPTLSPTQAYSTFHPFESITFNWTAVPGAATYVLQAATDPNFPIITRIQFDNIPNTTMTFEIGNPEGNYFARVIAVNANGIAGVPSNVITFSVFFNNPIGPPPVLSSPATGTTLTLPVTLTWADVPNPQPSGYELQIARDSGFASIEEDDPQLNGPSRTVLSLTSGTKFWRVRSAQGDNSPTTSAETAFSVARSFTIPAAPPTPVSVTVVSNPLYSGNTTWVAVQLTSAVAASGATINLSSSNSTAAPVPATIAMPGNLAWTQFQMTTGQVTSPTVVTLTATLNGASAPVQFTLQPPSLNSLIISPGTISGGAMPQLIVMLNGLAPAGAVVSLSSDSPAAQPPAVANVAPGSASASLAIPTSTVTANTTATLTATWNGVSAQAHVTLTAQQPPTSVTLSPTSTVGQNGGSFATVSIASPAAADDALQVTVDNPSVATVNSSVIIPAGNTRGGFNIFTTAVTTTTVVTISVSGGGVTQSATLTVTPAAPPPATLSAITLSPSTVAGGNTSQGTATLASAAPSGGAVVTLTSSNTARATVPASVTVAAGATSATFTVSTATATASTSATISGVSGGVSRSALLTISKTPVAASLSSLAVSPTSVTGGTSSQGTVTLTSAAPSGGATVTLTNSNIAAATVPASVTVAAGATKATFTVTTVSVTATTSATIGGTFGGASRSAVLTVTPPPPPASLSSVAVSPASVTGGTSSLGTVTLTSAAPAGGFTATLSSDNTAAATVPASVTVAQGATSATFAIATSSVTASTPVTITASAGGVVRTATLTVTPPGQSATLTVTATGRSGESVTSNPAGINVAVGSTMPAQFTTGTAITLTVSNGRNAVWSGACSNGGSKTCTFTFTGNATATANVQ